jgi:hypothetical protein
MADGQDTGITQESRQALLLRVEELKRKSRLGIKEMWEIADLLREIVKRLP